VTWKPDGDADIKALGKRVQRKLVSLLTLSRDVDPFLADTPGRLRAARWFAELWNTLGLRPGIHLRKIHYMLVSQPTPVIMPDGRPYENTVRCAAILSAAGRDARYNELIPANAIVDARAAAPEINLSDEEESSAEIDTFEGYVATLGLETALEVVLRAPEIRLTEPVINQRYHVEIWIEKSTMADILTPLGRRYGVNIVTGTGEMSTTSCEDLVRRAGASGLPIRILYLSDLDPGGVSMPVAMARKTEFISRKMNLDLQVRQIVLTVDQCEELDLPRIAIKETEKRADKFEERFGEGGCELDAIQAIHPGELRRIIETEILRYYDTGLRANIREVCNEARAEITAANEEVHGQHAEQLAELMTERDAINEEIAQFMVRLRTRCDGLQQRAQPLFNQMEQELIDRAPDEDDFDWPEPDEGDEDDDPLYDSTRDYLTQIDVYREHQGKADEAVTLRFQHTLICEVCNREFTSVRSNVTVCGETCRKTRWNSQNPDYHKQRYLDRKAANKKIEH
jgi:hypothetical protein